MNIINVNKDNFEEEVLKSDKKVLVDFWAGWCGPCQTMSKVIDDIAKKIPDDVKICKINVDEEASLTIKYNVSSIPTFLVFKNGTVENMTVGVQNKEKILELLK